MTTQRPMRFNNCDYNGLAHEWAYNHERDLRTGCDRMHTRGNTLYSYSTAIAYKIVDKQVLLLAREGFSVTTQKQKRAIRRAFGHWNIIEVNSDNIPEYDVSLERLLKKEVEECKHRLKYMLDNTRKNKQGVFARFEDRHDFCGHADTLRRLGEAFGKHLYNTHTKRHSKLEEYVLILEDYQESIVENREQARRERIRKEFEERVKRNEEAMNLFHQELGCAVKDVKFSKLINAFAKSCLPCHLSLHILREYFNVDDSYSFIWRMGDDVKTSQLITVPWRDVRMLLKLWKAGKPILGKKAGQYTVLSVNDDYVQVGCHRIPVANLNAIYEEEIKCL